MLVDKMKVNIEDTFWSFIGMSMICVTAETVISNIRNNISMLLLILRFILY
jgi:hypothetical protein